MFDILLFVLALAILVAVFIFRKIAGLVRLLLTIAALAFIGYFIYNRGGFSAAILLLKELLGKLTGG